jgi:HEAT repeat protein
MKRFLLAAACALGLAVSAAHARAPMFLGKPLDRWRNELNDSKPKVRRSAAFALGRMGFSAREAVPDLVRRLQTDTEASVRDMAASALGDIAKVMPSDRALWDRTSGVLVKALADSDGHVRRSAAYALGAFGAQAAGAGDALRAALADKDASVRQNAAWALGQIGEAAGGAVDALCGCLGDKDVLVRRDAAGALGSMGKPAAAAAEPLIKLVKSEADEVVKKTALDSLGHLAGPEHRKLAAGLEEVLADKDAEVALGAAIVLARIGGEESARALPVLQKALKDPDAHVQEVATASLVSLGPIAEPAMYDLADTLTNAKNPTIVRRNAALAIAHIGAAAKPVVPSLVQALKPSQPLQVRQFAAEALAQMKYPANEAALPAVLKAIAEDSDSLVRQKCVWSLFTMEDVKKNGADKVLAKVLEETSSEMALVRYDAARKLANALREEAPDKTVDVLLHMLGNKTLNVYNRTNARVEGVGTEATSGQANVKADTGGDARYMAAEALAWLGDKAKKRPEVIEALKNATKDKDQHLSDAAKQALKDLGVK